MALLTFIKVYLTAGIIIAILNFLITGVLGLISEKMCKKGTTTVSEIIDDEELMEEVSTYTTFGDTMKLFLGGAILMIVTWPYGIFIQAEYIAGISRRILSAIKES